MRITFRAKDFCLFLSLFILTVAGSSWAYGLALDRILEYISYAILLASVVFSFFVSGRIEGKKKKIWTFVFVSVLLSFGLCVQELPFGEVFPLIMTMLAISISSLLSEDYLDSYKMLKKASNAVLLGVIASFLLAILGGYSVMQSHSEILFGSGYAFSGGINIKNVFGADMAMVFIGNYLSEHYSCKSLGQKAVMALSVLMMLLSNSRGAIIMFIVFLLSMNIGFVRRITKRQRKLFVITLVLLCAAVFTVLFQELALNSFNYMMRIQGFQNYINHKDTNFMRLLLGNAKELYGTELDYVAQFRALYGWNGSVEFALLDILIKNGIVGLAGFVIIFYILIRTFVKSDYWEGKTAGVAIAVMLLISALVETYIQSIHTPVGIYCYLAMGGLAGQCERNKKMKLNVQQVNYREIL